MRSALLVASLLFAACSSSSSPSSSGGGNTTPDARASGDGGSSLGDAGTTGGDAPADAAVDNTMQQDYDDLATVLADMLRVPANVAIVDGINMAYGIPPAGFANIATGTWMGTHDAVQYTYTYHCEDENGFDTYTCGAGTNHIHWEVATQGTATVDTFAMTETKLVSHWHIRDIDVNKPRVEDNGRFYIAGKLSTDNARLSLTVDTVWTSVRLDPQPTVMNGGSIALTITAHRTRPTSVPTTRDFTATATVTFAQGAPATIVIDNVQTYTMDMTTGAVVHQ